MKLEDQVISLKLAKKLKKLGVRQESLFYWCIIDNGVDGEQDIIPLTEKEMDYYDDVLGSVEYTEIASAFTVAELGEMLPEEIIVTNRFDDKNIYFLDFCKFEDRWDVSYKNDILKKVTQCYVNGRTEANARAQMLVWLVENGYLKLKEEK